MVSVCLGQGTGAQDEQMWGMCLPVKDFAPKMLEYLSLGSLVEKNTDCYSSEGHQT